MLLVTNHILQQGFQTTNQLLVGDLATCTPITDPPLLPTGGHGVTFVAFIAQQGADAWIAFLAILLIVKNLFNVTDLICLSR